MARIVCIDDTQHETTEHRTVQFPLEINHDDLSTFRDGLIRCHWHDELEFSIVLQGDAAYTLGSGVHWLHAGEGILINACVPHTIAPCDENSVSLLTIIVAPSLICGPSGSTIESSLMRPFLHAGSLAAVPLHADELEALFTIDRLETEQPFAWELKCKELLCGVFFRLLTRCREELSGETVYGTAELQKLNILLEHLHSRYNEPLSLTQLADSVHLARESCCRFFKRMTGQTISQYLQDYRIAQSVKLLREGELSITQVALTVGFSNAGRFSAAFSKRMRCTPREYLHSLPEK